MEDITTQPDFSVFIKIFCKLNRTSGLHPDLGAIRQNIHHDIKQNEITLFHGKIEFNVESTGKKIVMQPLQKVLY